MTTKNKAAVALGRLGGLARSQKLTKEERSQSARDAAAARWASSRKKPAKKAPEALARP